MKLVPLADPGRFFPSELDEIMVAMQRVVDSGSWVLGDEVRTFESEFATYTGAGAVISCANGTDALALALSALQLPAASQVLVAANDGGYGAIAANQVGLTPFVVDVDASTGGPSVQTLEVACTERTTALIATHLHGDLLPMDEIDRWRKQHNLYLIEDCSQAHGLFQNDQHVGNTGDLATFSFYPTKNLGAIGDGGAVLIPAGRHKELYVERLNALRQYGWGERYRVDHFGGRNSRLDEIQAAILRARLPYLDTRNKLRQDVASLWIKALSGSELIERVGNGHRTVSHHIVATLYNSAVRPKIIKQLAVAGIATTVHYPYLVQEMKGLQTKQVKTPTADKLRKCIVTLPSEPLLSDQEKETVVSALLALH